MFKVKSAPLRYHYGKLYCRDKVIGKCLLDATYCMNLMPELTMHMDTKHPKIFI